MSEHLRRRVLDIIATDSTFQRTRYGDGEAWVGDCIHCRRRLVVSLSGEPISRVTVEHIVPQTHGGTDELANLALACAGCNHEKGVRHDVRRRDDPKLTAIIERLAQRRRQRWREPG